MKKYYVLLTGGKNNAGDFLIKHRAQLLLNTRLNNIDLIEFNAWEDLNNDKLDVINSAAALILTGGPSLVPGFATKTYRLAPVIDDIKVPIYTLGVGWYSHVGTWKGINEYRFLDSDQKVLDKLASNGGYNSVRDFHTMVALFNNGVKNVIMTGCPALYDLSIDRTKKVQNQRKRVAISIGVGFAESPRMLDSFKKLIELSEKQFGKDSIAVAFHHSINEGYLSTPNPRVALYKKNLKMVNYLTNKSIKVVDLSGGVNGLIDFYNEIDLHIGYRVHAHIYMSSINKNSILLTEDGRGRALSKVLGGHIYDGYEYKRSGTLAKVLTRLGLLDPYIVDEQLNEKLFEMYTYDTENGMCIFDEPRRRINELSQSMEHFLCNLP
jgi:hypothetical protein